MPRRPNFSLARDQTTRALLVVLIVVVASFGYLAYRSGKNAERIEQIQQTDCSVTNSNDAAFNRLLDQLEFNLRQSVNQSPRQIQQGLELYAAARRTLENC